MLPSRLSKTYPKVGRASVEVKHDLLGRSADQDFTEVHGVILLVLGSDFAGVRVIWPAGLLDQLVVHADTAALGDDRLGKATLVQAFLMKVWARLGGIEAETVHQIDVRLGAMTLVVLVGDGSDLLEAKITPDLCLGLKDGFHGCR